MKNKLLPSRESYGKATTTKGWLYSNNKLAGRNINSMAVATDRRSYLANSSFMNSSINNSITGSAASGTRYNSATKWW